MAAQYAAAEVQRGEQRAGPWPSGRQERNEISKDMSRESAPSVCKVVSQQRADGSGCQAERGCKLWHRVKDRKRREQRPRAEKVKVE